MRELVYFDKLAEQFGISGGHPPMGEPGAAPAGPVRHPNVWRKEGGEKLLSYLKETYKPGDAFQYDGHADCWLMLAVMDQLRACEISTYIGVFDKSLPIVPYRVGGETKEGQPCTFSLEEKGEDLLLTVHLDPEKTPFDMPFGEIGAPEIPVGKNLYVRLDGRHLLFAFPVSLTYGDICRSIIMDFDGECFCSVSHTPELAVGDLVENPFG